MHLQLTVNISFSATSRALSRSSFKWLHFFFFLQWFVIHLHVGVSQWPLLPLLCWSIKCLVSQHISSTFRALYIFLLSWAASCWSWGFQLVTPRPRSPPRHSVNNFFKVVCRHFQMHACMLKKKKLPKKGYLIVSTQFLTNQGCCLQHI